MTLVTEGSGSRAVAESVAAPSLPPFFRPFARREVLRSERFQQRRDQNIAWRAQDVLSAVGLGSVVAGLIPHVTHVTHGPAGVTLTVRTLPAQLPSDYTEHARRIAAGMGVARVRVVPVDRSTILVDLLENDPLRDTVELPQPRLATAQDLMLLGVDEVGVRYTITPTDLVHLIVQGATGSGKSVFVYGLLTQLVGIPEVLLAMSDPTSLLTRPFVGTVHSEWQASGPDVDAHIDLLTRLVELMDERIRTLPPRRDQVEVSDGTPLVMIVLEEYAGLIRSATILDAGKKSGGRVEKIKGLVGRLAAESRKAAMRLIILVQRAEASILDGYTRGQMAIKLSFRVADSTSVEMLHPTGKKAAEDHATAGPGVALLSGPGIDLARLRTPYIGCADDGPEYARYWDEVVAHAARLPADCP